MYCSTFPLAFTNNGSTSQSVFLFPMCVKKEYVSTLCAYVINILNFKLNSFHNDCSITHLLKIPEIGNSSATWLFAILNKNLATIAHHASERYVFLFDVNILQTGLNSRCSIEHYMSVKTLTASFKTAV